MGQSQQPAQRTSPIASSQQASPSPGKFIPDEKTQNLDMEYLRDLAKQGKINGLADDTLMLQKLGLPVEEVKNILQKPQNYGYQGLIAIKNLPGDDTNRIVYPYIYIIEEV